MADQLEPENDPEEYASDFEDTDIDVADDRPTRDDLSPSFDDDGWTFMRDSFDESDALQAFEDPPADDSFAQLPPQEAYESMKFMAPLSDSERAILNDTPFLDGLSWVDEPDQDAWMRERQSEGYHAIDAALEDQMYGDEEPGVSADGTESESGWNPFGAIKKAAKGVASAAELAVNPLAQARLAKRVAGGVVKKFVPSRDKQKAALLRQTNARLVDGHAAWLMTQDVKAGRPKQSKAYYTNISKAWAKGRLQAGGLPTSYTSGEVATNILGDDVMGSWWNPFSWFQSQTRYVLQNAQGQMISMNQAQWDAYQGAMAAQAADPNAQAVDPSQMDPSMVDPSQDPSMMDPSAAPAYDPNAAAAAYDPSQQYYDPSQDPNYDPNAQTSGDAMSDNTNTLLFGDGDDELQADAIVYGENDFQADTKGPEYEFMVGSAPRPTRHHRRMRGSRMRGDAPPSISAKKFKELCVRRAQTTSGADAPPEEHLVAAHKTVGKALARKGVMVRPPEGTPPGTSSGAWLYKLSPKYWLKSPEERAFIDEEKRNWEATKSFKKKESKKGHVLEAAKRAEYQAEQARAAKAQAEAIDTELKDVHESIQDSDSNMGAERAAMVGAAVAQGRADAQRTAAACDALIAKIQSGQSLSSDEVAKLRSCMKMCGLLRKLHDQLHATTSGYHEYVPPKGNPFVAGENVQEIVGQSSSGENVQEIIGKYSGYADILGGSSSPTQGQMVALTAIAATQPGKLSAYCKQQGIQLTPAEFAQLKAATNRAKIIMAHPEYANVKVSKSALSQISGDDSMGENFFAQLATAPLAAGALGASALAWGIDHAVVAPLKSLGALNNEVAKKGGWGGTPGLKSPTEELQHIMGAASTAGATKAQMIALTAVAASQPSKVAAFAKQNGITLSPKNVTQLKVATKRAKIIMSHPAYGQIGINKAAISQLSGVGADSMMGGFWTKLLTAPLAAGALGASALAWGAQKLVVGPAKTIGGINNWAAKKGGWSVPGYGGGGGPAAAPGMAPGMVPGSQQALSMQLPAGMPIPTPPAGLSPQLQQAYMQRQAAAYQRMAAAQAQSDAAQQQLAASADAANAEADALEAEAQARADQKAAMEANAGIPPDDSSSGVWRQGPDSGTLGAWRQGPDSGTLGWGHEHQKKVLEPSWFSGYEIEPIPHKPVETEKAKKITEEAQKNTPTGKKIRAGATLYAKAKGGDPKSRLAIAKIQKKAKTGDPQAKRDENAVRAGKIAVNAKGRAMRKIAAKSTAEARKKRVAAAQKKLEAGAAQRLAEHSRRKQYVRIAKIEHRAAHGDPQAKKVVAFHVNKAKQGDKKSQATVAAMKLAKHARTSARTPQDVKRQQQAGKLIASARHGNKKAIKQVALIHHAAKAGQPNAKRAMKHLEIAAHVERTVSTGKVSLPGNLQPGAAAKAAAKVDAQKKADVVRYEMLKKRVASPIGTKEEALAAAALGKKLGMKEEATALALRARSLRSAKSPIKDTAKIVAAAEDPSHPNHAEAKNVVADSLAAADRGEPAGISSAGKIAAAKAVEAVNKGQPMPREIAEATQLVDRAHSNDPEAKKIIANAGAAAQNPAHPNHKEAVELAVALTAASGVLAATAAKASSHNKWKSEAKKSLGQHVAPGEEGALKAELDAKVAKLRAGEGTYADGVRAREIAMALGMTGLAAQISAIMPPRDGANPMSSLASAPMPRIKGFKDFVWEALKAITLTTPDPFGNYKEGLVGRGSTPMLNLHSTAGRDDDQLATPAFAAESDNITTRVDAKSLQLLKSAGDGDMKAKKRLLTVVLAKHRGDKHATDVVDHLEGVAQQALKDGRLDKTKMERLHDDIEHLVAAAGLAPAKL